MKQYCLIFKPLSTISNIPDAQTIFGSICNIIYQTQGEDIFQEYIHSFEKVPLFIHSSMFPLGLLPMINQSLFSTEYINQYILKEKVDQQLAYLQTMKKYKKISYMSYEIYDNYIKNHNITQLQQDIIDSQKIVEENHNLIFANENMKGKMLSQLNTHAQKNKFYTSDEKQNDLFYDDSIYCDEHLKFCIYVKTHLSKEKLYDIFKFTKYFGIGPKHSVGKNSFELIDILEITKSSSNQYKLLLSKSFFDQDFDLNHSFYSIDSRLHKSSYYYMKNQLVGRYNLFKEGSYMKVSQNKEWYGQLVKKEYNQQSIYYYAIGYVF